jgi:hypothetical protein
VLSLPSAVKIFLCVEPTDMRRGFDRLAEMTRSILHQDPHDLRVMSEIVVPEKI